MSVKQKAEVSKPSAGYSTTRHAGKDNIAAPANAGVTPDPQKDAYDQKHGRFSGSNKPEAGARDRGKDPKNASKPEGGGAAIPKEHLHLDKAAFEKSRKHEPKSKGKYYQDGSTTTKC